VVYLYALLFLGVLVRSGIRDWMEAALRLPRLRSDGGSEGVTPNPDCSPESASASPDSQSFGAAFADYVGPIYRYCYSRLRSREAAEDATSETFLKAFAALAAHRGPEYGPWLFAIARRVVVDHHRRGLYALDVDSIPVVDSDPGPEEYALGESDRLMLRRAVDGLPLAQKHAILLYVSGWSVADSAKILSKSDGAVKMLRRRGLASLRSALLSSAEYTAHRDHHNLQQER
jgi:RNA polymerase sigma-70 factor (ECF subfamily)